MHGKKASVITFGSELQTMSPEERLRLRKQMQNDESKLSVPLAIEDEDYGAQSGFDPTVRRASAVSGSSSTNTTKSAPSEESRQEQPRTVDAPDETSEAIKQT